MHTWDFLTMIRACGYRHDSGNRFILTIMYREASSNTLPDFILSNDGTFIQQRFLSVIAKADLSPTQPYKGLPNSFMLRHLIGLLEEHIEFDRMFWDVPEDAWSLAY